jgi:Flp pilus assembly protein TadB
METSVIVGLLVIAAVWSVYLLPMVFGERKEAMSSTEEFDRWTHSMAYVQKHTASDLAASHRDGVQRRRRRTLAVLLGLTVLSLFGAWYFNSLPLLLSGLFFGSLVALYLLVLAQLKQRRNLRLKVTHVAERTPEWEEPQVKVVGS